MRFRKAQVEDAPGIARVHVDTWRTTYRGIVHDEVLDELSYQRSEQGWQASLKEPQPERHIHVAEAEGGHIVGFADSGPLRDDLENYEGEVYALYVREEHQAAGCGRQLMAMAAQCLLSDGLTSLLVWVLADNPACRFYEALGGRPVAEKKIEIGDATLQEIGYGWVNLETLLIPGM